MVMAATSISESLSFEEVGEVFLSLQECSTDGMDWLQVSFSQPLSSEGNFLVIIDGSEQKHSISAKRIDGHTLSLQLPAHDKAETVALKVYHAAGEHLLSAQSCLLYERDFVYTASSYDVSQYQAELLMQSVVDMQAARLLYSVLPPLVALSAEELREFDRSLTEAVKRTQLPLGWGMTGLCGDSQEQAKQQSVLDTPLHFSAKYKLTQLFSHLLTLPGVLHALSTPNEQGLLPLDLARNSGSQEIVYLIAEATGSPSDVGESLSPTHPPAHPTADCQLTREENMKELYEQRTHPFQSELAISPRTTPSLTPDPSHFSIHLTQPVGMTSPELLLREWIQRHSWSRRNRWHSLGSGLNELYLRKAEAEAHEGVQIGMADRPSSTLISQQIAWLGHWSCSCPCLNGKGILLPASSELIHSALTSPRNLSSCYAFNQLPVLPLREDSSSFPITFLRSSHGQTTDQEQAGNPTSDPHPMHVPAVCVEDQETNEGVCLKMGVATLPKTSSQESVESFGGKGSPDNMVIEGGVGGFDASLALSEEESEDKEEPFQINFASPLASKSAPDLSQLGESDQDESHKNKDPETKPEDMTVEVIPEIRRQKSYSVVNPPEELRFFDSESPTCTVSGDREVPNYDKGTDSSATTVEVGMETPTHSVSTIEGMPSSETASVKQSRRRGHHKSFSVSGAKIFIEEKEENVVQETTEETKVRRNAGPHATAIEGERSRGSSFLSSSSKQESSLSDTGEYELEEESFLTSNEDIKSRSEVSLHSSSGAFLGSCQMERETSASLGTLNSHSEEESHTPGDDQLDVTSRHMHPHLSAVVVTNIDEYSASGEDEDEGDGSHSPSLPNFTSTPGVMQSQAAKSYDESAARVGLEGHVSSMSSGSVMSEAAAVIQDLLYLSTGLTGSPSAADKRVSVGSDVFTDDIALSDIELKVESPNSSFSTEGVPEEKVQVSNGSIPQHNLAQIAGNHHDLSSIARRGSLPVNPRAPSSPVPSSQNLDDAAHSAISKLRLLATGASMPTFQGEGRADRSGGHWSDDSDTPALDGSGRRQKMSPGLTRQTGSLNIRHSPVGRVVRSATTVSEASHNHKLYRHEPTLTISDSSSLDFPVSTNALNSPRKTEFSPHPPSPLVSIASPQFPASIRMCSPHDLSPAFPVPNDREEEEPSSDSYDVLSVKRGSVLVTSSSPKDKKNLSRSADNLLAEEPTGNRLESLRGNKPSEDCKKDEKDSGIKLLRFRQFDEGDIMRIPKDEAATAVTEETKSQDKPTKKGLTRLLSRRDSKKERRSERIPKKSDSSSSLDSMAQAGAEDSQRKYQVMKEKSFKSRPSAQEIEFVPPVSKNRSATLSSVGEFQLPSSPSSQHRRLNSKFDPVEEREESTSPSRAVSPSSKVETLSLGGDKSETSSLSASLFEEPPELVEESIAYLNQTMNRRIKKYSNKHERSRQGTIFDWIRTEKHFYLSLLVLRRVFWDTLKSQLSLSEEILNQLFPFLDELLDISNDFSQKLIKRQKESQLEDISDILLERFSGQGGEEMLRVYSGFVCREPAALELYRDFERKKTKFMRVMNMLYQNKHCERKKLPDFYLLMAQRVSKYVEMMKKLVKESEALKLNHVPRLKESSAALARLVTSVDLAVKDYNNQKQLEEIQGRLEIQIPKSLIKTWDRKGLKNLDLTAQNRKLLRRGEAIWQGHGKQLGVHIVLVTDLLILLTDRDQKYNIAQLQDLKPPVVRLYGLHVRMNASVKSGVQLLLLEQGDHPEMFRLEFTSKKVAKEWEESLNAAAEFCKSNELKCEYFGAEPMHSGDEHLDEESDDEGEKDDGDLVTAPPSDVSPSSLRKLLLERALEQASRLLSSASASEEGTTLSRNQAVLTASLSKEREGTTSVPKAVRPVRSTTMYVSSRSQLGAETGGDAAYKRKGNKKSVKDKCSFCEDTTNDKQILLECISQLKESMEYLMEENEDKEQQIKRLRADMDRLRAEQRIDHRDSSGSNSPSLQRSLGSRSSFKNRPHSVHSDLFENGPAPDFSNLSPSPQANSRRSEHRIKEANAHWNLM